VSESREIEPSVPETCNVTHLLLEIQAGNEGAMTRLVPVVYRELRRLAAYYMKRERPDHTLQPTALVHEVYFRLVGQMDRSWQNRAHFFAVAAHAMRGVLVDHARANLAQKRGEGKVHVELGKALDLASPEPADVLFLNELLDRLAEIDSRASRVVELRWFVGLSVEEVAHVMGISEKTVRRDWYFAKAWLQTELNNQMR
jgi:RNA polymerase sigma factor (TIGR02999 family)